MCSSYDFDYIACSEVIKIMIKKLEVWIKIMKKRLGRVLMLDILVFSLIVVLMYQITSGNNGYVIVTLREVIEVLCFIVLYLLTK